MGNPCPRGGCFTSGGLAKGGESSRVRPRIDEESSGVAFVRILFGRWYAAFAVATVPFAVLSLFVLENDAQRKICGWIAVLSWFVATFLAFRNRHERVRALIEQRENTALVTLGVSATNLRDQHTTLSGWRLEITRDCIPLNVVNERILTRLVIHRESVDTESMSPAVRPLLVLPSAPIAELVQKASECKFARGVAVEGYLRFSIRDANIEDFRDTAVFRLTLIDAFEGEHVIERPPRPWPTVGILGPA